MTPQYLLFAIPLLLSLTIFEIVVDIVRRKKHFSLPDTITNISCGIGNQGLNLFTEGLKLFLFIDIFFHQLAIMQIPHAWWSIILCLFLFDFAFYWEHRLSHMINILWGTHVVHHSSEEFNLSIALRRSWLADIVVIIFFLPIPMLGFQPETFLMTVIIHNVYQYVIHTRAIGKLHPAIEFVMHTPSHHRVHHGKDPKYIDKNFSGVFILYDRLFNTFKEEEEEPTYGITTQLKTNNPLVINLHYYASMVHTLRQINSWKDKLRFIFARPGWFPEYLGGYKAPPKVDKKLYRKYQPQTPTMLNYYVLVQFFSVLAGLLTLMVAKKALGSGIQPAYFEYLFFGLIAISSVIPIAIFDRRAWVIRAEYFRLGLIPTLVGSYMILYHPLYAIPALIVLSLFTISMVLWFRSLWKHPRDLEMV